MNLAKPCLIYNPSARGGKARRIHSHPDVLGGQCVFLATAAAGDARRLAAQAVRNGFQTIIAAGGDGTVNEVLNGIADEPGGLRAARLGVLPLGTMNVFARELGLPLQTTRALETLAAGREKSIDLGWAEFTSEGRRERRCFLQLAGAGLDSRAIELTEWNLKKKIGPLAYVVAGIKALCEKKPIVTVAGTREGSGEWIVLGNGRYYGGPFPIFPKARLDDGMIDICVVRDFNPGRIIAGLAGLLIGRPQQFCRNQQWAAPSVTLTSPSRVVLELDGENVGELPATISVEPKALRVIVP